MAVGGRPNDEFFLPFNYFLLHEARDPFAGRKLVGEGAGGGRKVASWVVEDVMTYEPSRCSPIVESLARPGHEEVTEAIDGGAKKRKKKRRIAEEREIPRHKL